YDDGPRKVVPGNLQLRRQPVIERPRLHRYLGADVPTVLTASIHECFAAAGAEIYRGSMREKGNPEQMAVLDTSNHENWRVLKAMRTLHRLRDLLKLRDSPRSVDNHRAAFPSSGE